VEYEDERELTRYVWDFYGQLMTPFEQRVGWAHLAEGKVAIGHPEVAEFILRRHSIAGDQEAQAALADGVEAFRRRVCRRVLAEQGAKVFVNRCPSCGSVVRTPQALQCFWCGFDWHSAEAEPPYGPSDFNKNESPGPALSKNEG
jgi:hypothetical protein